MKLFLIRSTYLKHAFMLSFSLTFAKRPDYGTLIHRSSLRSSSLRGRDAGAKLRIISRNIIRLINSMLLRLMKSNLLSSFSQQITGAFSFNGRCLLAEMTRHNELTVKMLVENNFISAIIFGLRLSRNAYLVFAEIIHVIIGKPFLFSSPLYISVLT